MAICVGATFWSCFAECQGRGGYRMVNFSRPVVLLLIDTLLPQECDAMQCNAIQYNATQRHRDAFGYVFSGQHGIECQVEEKAMAKRSCY